MATTEPLILFHGTSSLFKAQIMRHGLRPRRLHGKSVYAGQTHAGASLESDPELVYLTDTYAIQFARIACEAFGGSPMIVKARIPDPSILLPDTDFANLKTGVDCLSHGGTCAVRADSLMPSKIYMLDVKWVNETYGGTKIETGNLHRAIGPDVRDALGYALMTSRREYWLSGEQWLWA